MGGGRNFDIVESYSAPVGRTVLQPGLAPVRYERVSGAGPRGSSGVVISSAYTPHLLQRDNSRSFGHTVAPVRSYGRTADAYSYSSPFGPASPPVASTVRAYPHTMYKQFAASVPLVYGQTVSPVPTTSVRRNDTGAAARRAHRPLRPPIPTSRAVSPLTPTLVHVWMCAVSLLTLLQAAPRGRSQSGAGEETAASRTLSAVMRAARQPRASVRTAHFCLDLPQLVSAAFASAEPRGPPARLRRPLPVGPVPLRQELRADHSRRAVAVPAGRTPTRIRNADCAILNARADGIRGGVMETA